MGNGTGTAAAMDGIHASVARLDALFLEDARLENDTGADADADAGADGVAGVAGGGAVVDVLQRRYEIRLERLAVTKQLEAQIAGVKARDTAEAIELQHAMTPPEAPAHERTYAEISAVEEIAGVLTISSAAAGALVTQSRQLTALPPAMDALSAGTISWQHAKIIADETDSLDPAGAAALVAPALNPNPARGATSGELVPGRFRTKVRNWRERHHPEYLEKRHAKCAADRRMEYTPDRDGMAWISLYIPAHQGSAIWNRTTAIARGLQGPNEPRTITQLRPDIAASLLLRAGPALTHTNAPNTNGTNTNGTNTNGTNTGQNTRGEGNPGEHATGQGSMGERNPRQDNTGQGNPGEDSTVTIEDGGQDIIGLASLAPADVNDTGTTTGSTDHEATAATGTAEYESTADHETPGAAEQEANGGNEYAELGTVPVPKADVLVTVPMAALLGQTDEPAHLDGFGPIPASMARELVANGASSFYRVLVDPRDGAPLEIGRTNYRLTKAMKKHCNSGTENAPSPAATTHPSTTRQTTFKPGSTAATPGSATWPNSAQNTTTSNTTAAGNPHQPPQPNHPAGPHPPADTTKPNNPTTNHPTGQPAY